MKIFFAVFAVLFTGMDGAWKITRAISYDHGGGEVDAHSFRCGFGWRWGML